MPCYSVPVTGGRTVHFEPDVRHRMASAGPLCTTEPTGTTYRHRPAGGEAWSYHGSNRGRSLGAGTACSDAGDRMTWSASSLARWGRDRRADVAARKACAGWFFGSQEIGGRTAADVMTSWEWTHLSSAFAGPHARPCRAWRQWRTDRRESYLFDFTPTHPGARRTGKLMRSEYGLQWVGRTPEGYPVDGIALFTGL